MGGRGDTYSYWRYCWGYCYSNRLFKYLSIYYAYLISLNILIKSLTVKYFIIYLSNVNEYDL